MSPENHQNPEEDEKCKWGGKEVKRYVDQNRDSSTLYASKGTRGVFPMREWSVFFLFPALHVFRSPLLPSSSSRLIPPTRRYFNSSVDRHTNPKSFARQQHLLMHQKKKKRRNRKKWADFDKQFFFCSCCSSAIILLQRINPSPSYDPIPIRIESQNRKGMERKKKENTTWIWEEHVGPTVYRFHSSLLLCFLFFSHLLSSHLHIMCRIIIHPIRLFIYHSLSRIWSIILFINIFPFFLLPISLYHVIFRHTYAQNNCKHMLLFPLFPSNQIHSFFHLTFCLSPQKYFSFDHRINMRPELLTGWLPVCHMTELLLPCVWYCVCYKSLYDVLIPNTDEVVSRLTISEGIYSGKRRDVVLGS